MSRGEIKKVGDLFAKYRHTLKAPQGSVIQAFVEVVWDLLSIKVKKEGVSYNPQTRTLSLKRSGPLKTEIKLHQEDILNHLKGRLGEKNSPHQIL